jgi:lipoprotein-anchoring transpeptidase ErfK/SrfK
MLRVLISLFFVAIASPALAAGIMVVVDISEQTMSVRLDGVEQYSWSVSTGRAGYGTPVGLYGPTRMHARYFSRKYDNAPMPYAIFFYEGYAIHGTTYIKSLGAPASHGCVRLDPDNAALLYSLVKEHGRDDTRITIHS